MTRNVLAATMFPRPPNAVIISMVAAATLVCLLLSAANKIRSSVAFCNISGHAVAQAVVPRSSLVYLAPSDLTLLPRLCGLAS